MALPSFILKFTNLGALIKRIEFLLIKAKEDTQFLDQQGQFVIDRIRAFTRSGKSIAEGRPRKLKKLSNSYKDMRRGAVKFRTLPDGRVVAFPEADERLEEVDREFFDPDTSNLTFTGQMLRALRYIITNEKTIQIEVDASPRSGKYEKLTNAQVADYVAQNGRPFIGLDDNGIKRIKKETIKQIRQLLKKNNLR